MPMTILDKKTKKPFVNIWFGNFYKPAFDDKVFIDEAISFLKDEGFSSILLDSKAWEDFKSRFEGKEATQYVEMQEYMQQVIKKNALSHCFLALYLNGDNLYPNIRFSPPIYGESVVKSDGTDGKWYRYWSDKAKDSMCSHVKGLLSTYNDGLTEVEYKGDNRKPIVSMWDPIVAPSFDKEGQERYLSFLKTKNKTIENLNVKYASSFTSFEELKPQDYWLEEKDLTQREKTNLSKECKQILYDNRMWQREELIIYFKDMKERLHNIDSSLLLTPVLAQWGYFLTVNSTLLSKVGFADLWDTANRGIDIYALKGLVDVVHFISVPVTPYGDPDCYVTSYHHSQLRCLNHPNPFLGGIFYGRYLYNDLYAILTPHEILGTILASGAGGYISYGMCGLDDGGLLHRMEPYFNENLKEANKFFTDTVPMLGKRLESEIALLFPSQMALSEPLTENNSTERRLDSLGYYHALSDLGLSVDVIDLNTFISTSKQYKVLVIPENDQYLLEPNKTGEEKLKEFVVNGGTIIHSPGGVEAISAFNIEQKQQQTSHINTNGEKAIVFSVDFKSYDNGEMIATYDDGGKAIVRQTIGNGNLISFGFDYGLSYINKVAPHVPREEKNNELYPVSMLKTNILKAILETALNKELQYRKDIEIAKFEKGAVVINHTSYKTVYGEKEIPGHSSVFISNN